MAFPAYCCSNYSFPADNLFSLAGFKFSLSCLAVLTICTFKAAERSIAPSSAWSTRPQISGTRHQTLFGGIVEAALANSAHFVTPLAKLSKLEQYHCYGCLRLRAPSDTRDASRGGLTCQDRAADHDHSAMLRSWRFRGCTGKAGLEWGCDCRVVGVAIRPKRTRALRGPRQASRPCKGRARVVAVGAPWPLHSRRRPRTGKDGAGRAIRPRRWAVTSPSPMMTAAGGEWDPHESASRGRKRGPGLSRWDPLQRIGPAEWPGLAAWAWSRPGLVRYGGLLVNYEHSLIKWQVCSWLLAHPQCYAGTSCLQVSYIMSCAKKWEQTSWFRWCD